MINILYASQVFDHMGSNMVITHLQCLGCTKQCLGHSEDDSMDPGVVFQSQTMTDWWFGT